MKIFIAGATGVLGRRLLTRLAERGHSVVGLAHQPHAAPAITALGGVPHRASLFDPAGLAAGMQGVDVVIHAATRIPNKLRLSLKDWQENDRIRTAGTRALAQAAARAGASGFVYQSIIWVVQPPGGAFYDEDTPPNPGAVERSSLEAERIAAEVLAPAGIPLAILRCGMFYGADSSQTLGMGQALARRAMPIFGDGAAPWSLLHLDDAASAFVLAAERRQAGLWHVVDDQPVAAADFLAHFARLLGAPAPRRLPLWLGRLLLGPQMTGFLTRPVRTSAARLRRDLGWRPQYPGYQAGLAQIVDQWKKEQLPWITPSTGPVGQPGG